MQTSGQYHRNSHVVNFQAHFISYHYIYIFIYIYIYIFYIYIYIYVCNLFIFGWVKHSGVFEPYAMWVILNSSHAMPGLTSQLTWVVSQSITLEGWYSQLWGHEAGWNVQFWRPCVGWASQQADHMVHVAPRGTLMRFSKFTLGIVEDGVLG